MCHTNYKKPKTTNDGRNRTTKSRKKNQNARKYLEILKVDTIKHTEMLEKIKTNTAREGENYSKQNYIAEISSKG